MGGDSLGVLNDASELQAEHAAWQRGGDGAVPSGRIPRGTADFSEDQLSGRERRRMKGNHSAATRTFEDDNPGLEIVQTIIGCGARPGNQPDCGVARR